MTVTWTLRDGLKWSDGAAAHLRRLQVRLGVGPGPGQRRRHDVPASTDITAIDCPSDTEMVWHFKNIYEGYITLDRRPRCRATTSSKIPIKDQVNGAGFRAERGPEACRSAARSSSSR